MYECPKLSIMEPDAAIKAASTKLQTLSSKQWSIIIYFPYQEWQPHQASLTINV
jgi:hypothetical protein